MSQYRAGTRLATSRQDMNVAPSINDAADPIGDARVQLASVRDPAHTIVLIGAGLGHATEMAATRWPTALVIVVEPDADAAAAATRRTPSLYDSRRVRLLTGPDYPGGADLWRLFDRPAATDSAGLTIASRGAAALSHPVEFAKARRLVVGAIEAARMNARAREENAGRYLLNTLRNLPVIAGSGDPSRLASRFSGVPAIIVGAGPSLDRQLDDLRASAASALIVAADTAWRPLVSAGINPHFVIAVDPTEANGRHLREVHPSRQTWGIVEGSVDPIALSAFSDSLFTFRVGTHHPWPWLQTIGIERSFVRAWGSVLTSAFDLTLSFGCDPIVFAGADMAFTDGRPYCRGTTFEEDWARHTARGASLRQVWKNTLAARALLKGTDLNGEAVLTAKHLIEFRNWIVRRAGEASSSSLVRVFNSSPAGLLSGGVIQQTDLRSVFAPRSECDAAVRQIIRDAAAPASPSASTDVIVRGLDALEGRNTSAALIQDWLTFGRPSLTVDAIDAAASFARHRLTHGVRSARPSQSPAAESHLPPRPRIHAADRVAHMRAQLTGDTAGLDGCAAVSEVGLFGEVPPATAARKVIAALLAMPRLTTGWGEDVSQGSEAATIPLSHRYAWSAGAKPLVDSLEAWLLHPGFSHRAAASKFWNAPIVSTHDGQSMSTSEIPAAEAEARRTLVGIQLGQSDGDRSNHRSARVLQSLESARAFPNLFDLVMRAVTGTIARPAQSARDPREGFAHNHIDYIEPQVLTDRGLPLGWNVATAKAGCAIFTPRQHNHSLAIDESGTWSAMRPWPEAIVGEVPWKDGGGALAWNTSAQVILSRSDADERDVVDHVSFQPSRVVQTSDGALIWASLNGGLWAWSPGQSGRLLIDTPKCIGLRVDNDHLVLSPVARDPSGKTSRSRLRVEHHYRPEDQGLRQGDATSNGPFAGHASRNGWTAMSHPFADLVRLDATDGRSFVLAVYSPLQVAWAGGSLVVTIADGVALLFPNLIERLEGITGQLA